jgi:hypothetical protein
MRYSYERAIDFEDHDDQLEVLQDSFEVSSGRFIREQGKSGRRGYLPRRALTQKRRTGAISDPYKNISLAGPQITAYSREQLLDHLQETGESAIASPNPLKVLELSMPLAKPHQIYHRPDPQDI